MRHLSLSALRLLSTPSEMRNRDLSRELSRLNDLIKRTTFATEDIELQGHWGRYLCVVAAGFVENGLQTIYSDYAVNSASGPVARYVNSRLESVYNPNAQRFIDVAGSFNVAWRELEEFLQKDEGSRKEALDSIMNNRNQIAHGKSVGVTVHRVRDYIDRCVEVLEFIEDQCDGRVR